VPALTHRRSYEVEASSWTRESEMGKPEELVADFAQRAADEGLELRDARRCLLREAIEGGWADRKVIVA
jgi:hypothetical protein